MKSWSMRTDGASATLELLEVPWRPAVSGGWHVCDLCQFPHGAATFSNRDLFVPTETTDTSRRAASRTT